jgi:hypothetical protein
MTVLVGILDVPAQSFDHGLPTSAIDWLRQAIDSQRNQWGDNPWPWAKAKRAGGHSGLAWGSVGSQIRERGEPAMTKLDADIALLGLLIILLITAVPIVLALLHG